MMAAKKSNAATVVTWGMVALAAYVIFKTLPTFLKKLTSGGGGSSSSVGGSPYYPGSGGQPSQGSQPLGSASPLSFGSSSATQRASANSILSNFLNMVNAEGKANSQLLPTDTYLTPLDSNNPITSWDPSSVSNAFTDFLSFPLNSFSIPADSADGIGQSDVQQMEELQTSSYDLAGVDVNSDSNGDNLSDGYGDVGSFYASEPDLSDYEYVANGGGGDGGGVDYTGGAGGDSGTFDGDGGS